LAILVVVFLVASARLFVWPPTNSPAKVDAIVALGGVPGQPEAHKAIALAASGYSRTVVVSLGGYPPAPCPVGVDKVRVLCFRPNPLDTRGEAEHVGKLAASHHWNSLIVVPERSQATRARLLFKRCTTARLLIVPVSDPASKLPFDVVYEWGSLLKALVLKTSC
jgi:hypothetical protein